MPLRVFLAACLGVGAAISSSGAVIFPTDSDWAFLKGFSEASSPDPTAWREVNFDDSAGPTDWTYYSTLHFGESSAGLWTVARAGPWIQRRSTGW